MAAKTPASASTRTEALRQLAGFPLVEALLGRRSRRFALGDELPDGPLAYRSNHQPMPLDELERLLVLAAMGGTTGWHYSITRHARYAPQVSNYAAGQPGGPSPRRLGSTPPSCSSPTTPAAGSSRPPTPVRWSTRRSSRSRPS
jgi:hypothetical protein